MPTRFMKILADMATDSLHTHVGEGERERKATPPPYRDVTYDEDGKKHDKYESHHSNGQLAENLHMIMERRLEIDYFTIPMESHKTEHSALKNATL